MTTHERNIIKEIYPKACDGNKWAMKVLANLTTKRRSAPKCRRDGCENRVVTKSRRENPKFCSQLCDKIERRTSRTVRAILSLVIFLALSVSAEDVSVGWKNGINPNATTSWKTIVYASTNPNPGPSNAVSTVAVNWPTTNATLSSLPSGTKLYFAVYHYDLEDLSDPSNYIYYKTKMNAPQNATKLP